MKRLLLNKITFLKKNPYILLILCAFIILIASLGIPLKDFVGGCGSDDSSEEMASDMAERDEIERILSEPNEDDSKILANIKSLAGPNVDNCSDRNNVVLQGYAPILATYDRDRPSNVTISLVGKEYVFMRGPFPATIRIGETNLLTQPASYNLSTNGSPLQLNWNQPYVTRDCQGIFSMFYWANTYKNRVVDGRVLAYVDVYSGGKIDIDFRIVSYTPRQITNLQYSIHLPRNVARYNITGLVYNLERQELIGGNNVSRMALLEEHRIDSMPEVLFLGNGAVGVGIMSATRNRWINGNNPAIVIDNSVENETIVNITPIDAPLNVNNRNSPRDIISILPDTERCGNRTCGQHEDVDSCPSDCPQPPVCTWDVLNGPVPAGTSTVRGDGSDETQGLQAILNAMRPQEVVCFPVSPVSYGVTNLQITVNDITLYSAGWTGGINGREARTNGTHVGATIRRNIAGDTLLSIMADGITIDGLKLEGPGYNQAYLDYIIHSSNRQRTTIRNCKITDYGRGISLENNSNYYLISNNRIERIMYAGIYIGSSYGHIFSNYIHDLNDPDAGAGNSMINSYGIVLSGNTPQNQPNYNLILDNYVGHIIRWAGIMIHAGSYNLIAGNYVEDIIGRALQEGGDQGLAAGIAKTFYPALPEQVHDHNSIINNKIEHTGLCAHVSGIRAETDDPGEEVPYEDKNSFIGNTCNDAAQSASCTSNGQRNLRLHHNAWLNINYARLWHFFKGHIDLHSSNNTSTGSVQGVMVFWDVDANGQQVVVPSWEDITHPRHSVSVINNLPAPNANPSNLRVYELPSGNRLSWEYPLVNTANEDHDSFEIQFRYNESAEWTTIAFRPPNDGRFSFVSENRNVVPFNPLVFIHRADSRIGKYRIRAWNGDTPSEWSNEVESVN